MNRIDKLTEIGLELLPNGFARAIAEPILRSVAAMICTALDWRDELNRPKP